MIWEFLSNNWPWLFVGWFLSGLLIFIFWFLALFGQEIKKLSISIVALIGAILSVLICKICLLGGVIGVIINIIHYLNA